MRLLAFSLFATAAFDWPMPWLDRAGTAALGLALLALALAPSGLVQGRSARMTFPPQRAQVADEWDDTIGDVLERLGAYSDREAERT